MIFTEEIVTKAFGDMSEKSGLELVDAVNTVTLFLANARLKELLVLKMKKFEKQIERIEKMPGSCRKSLEGQDSDYDDDTETKWPSLSE